jgi:hypothetical protein
MARYKMKDTWEDELFDEIQIGDTIYYENERGQTWKGKAKIQGPMGWVIDIGQGIPKVVNEGYNYLGHTPAKKGQRVPDFLGKFLNGK